LLGIGLFRHARFLKRLSKLQLRRPGAEGWKWF
jgi:hypothetical protein